MLHSCLFSLYTVSDIVTHRLDLSQLSLVVEVPLPGPLLPECFAIRGRDVVLKLGHRVGWVQDGGEVVGEGMFVLGYDCQEVLSDSYLAVGGKIYPECFVVEGQGSIRFEAADQLRLAFYDGPVARFTLLQVALSLF